MNRTLGRTLPALTAALWLASAAGAATITVVNLDGGGEGFNDPTPAVPVGGNPGTTLGAQRLNAFQFAANIWGAQLVSAVTILVDAEMNPLLCDAMEAVLGQAGPNTVHRDFMGALVPGTWYPQALANKLRGADLTGVDDIGAEFNSSIGTTCPFPISWYYGLDASPPPATVDFVSVVLHEIGHGLGFLSLVDDTTGAKFLGFDDTYMRNLEDHSLGLLWPAMSNAQRMASVVDTGDLHWTGAIVVANGGFLSSGRHASGYIEMYAPNPLEPGSSVSHWSTSLFPNQLMEPIYTGPTHATSLSRDLMTDIGWGSAPPLAPIGHLKCYKTKDARAKASYTLDLMAGVGGFANEIGCTLKLGSKRICVEVDKQNVAPPPPGGGPTIGPNTGSVFLSYKIKCLKQTVAPVTLIDQFGPGSFPVFTAKELLVPALPGPPNDHLKCYKTRDTRPKAAYTLDLIAGVAGFNNELGCSVKLGAKTVCVQVTKQNVAPPPPGGGPAPGPGAGAKLISYKLKCPKQALSAVGAIDQFGAGTFTPGTAAVLLVPAGP